MMAPTRNAPRIYATPLLPTVYVVDLDGADPPRWGITRYVAVNMTAPTVTRVVHLSRASLREPQLPIVGRDVYIAAARAHDSTR